MKPTRSITIQSFAHVFVFFALLVGPVSMLAQKSNDRPPRRNWGYVFAGVRLQDQVVQIPFPEPHRFKVHSAFDLSRGGLGWEWLLYRGVAVGVEGSGRPRSGGRVDTSFNLSYHFVNLPRVGSTLAPFATFGETIAWGVGDSGLGAGESGPNLGGGANLWLHRRIGPRFEIRKYWAGYNQSFVEFRGGVTFR
jgi:hypothetical protein